ncbi:MAG TPA: hypothetical protein VMJ66_09715 [Geobacteraceae bacterium]|nr:hypothetical protein [Geobacteraceae bacterium]
MTDIIERITFLLGIHRDGRAPVIRRKKAGRPRRENDTITISDEARRLSCSSMEERATDDTETI